MLVLSRHQDEALIVGGLGELFRKEGERFVPVEPITVLVVETRGDRVRIGIDADKRVSVHRGEVLEAIRRERAEKAEVVG